MKFALRLLATFALVALLWPEFGRYRAEWQLADAGGHLQRVLRGLDRGATAHASVQRADALARGAAASTPGDERAALLLGIALILQQRGADAAAALEAAIARGERPELTLNLGRARTALGDTAGADAAYLRTAWASPLALATLPKTMRDDLLARVALRESELHAGTLRAPPPLDAEPRL